MMSIESIASIGGMDGIAVAGHAGPAAAAPAAPESFGGMVSSGLHTVNTQLMSTQTALQQLAVGDTQNLHQVMISLEEARMSFQLLMQVRNRALESYQELMRMSV